MKSFNLAEVFDRVIVLELAMHEHVEADFLLERHTLGALLPQKGPYSPPREITFLKRRRALHTSVVCERSALRLSRALIKSRV